MYKVFFKDRIVTLGEDLPGASAVPDQQIHRYHNQSELKELILQFDRKEQIGHLHIVHEDISTLTKAFRACFICIDAGGGVVLNEKKEFLVIKRNGVWDLPKGKLEKGEDFGTAALREVEEETGLVGLEMKQLLVSTFHTYPLGEILVLKETRWFEMRYHGQAKPILQETEGITAYRWVKSGKTGFIMKNSYRSILDVLKTRELL